MRCPEPPWSIPSLVDPISGLGFTTSRGESARRYSISASQSKRRADVTLRFALEAGVLISPTRTRLELSPSIGYGQRRYTTSSTGDAIYHGRTDSSVYLQLGLQYGISGSASLRATYLHDGVRAGISNAQDEDTSYDRNVTSVSLALRY